MAITYLIPVQPSVWAFTPAPAGSVELAAPFDASPVHRNRVAAILALLGSAASASRPHTRLLEIGCGAGHVAARLARAGYDVTGIDIHRPSVDAARACYPVSRLAFDCVPVSAVDLQPYPCLVLTEVLEHVRLWEPMLRDLHAAARPDARLIVTVPNGWGVTEVLCRPSYGLKRWPVGIRFVQAVKRQLRTRDLTTADPGTPHVHFFTLGRLVRGFAAAGWSVEAWGRMFWLWPAWETFFSERPAPPAWAARDFARSQRLPPRLAALWAFRLVKAPAPRPRP